MLQTIRQKVIAGCVIVLALSVGGAAAGLWVADDLTAALQRSALSSAILRNHMQADQMHDALHGDVLSAIEARDPALGLNLADVKTDLSAHVKLFQESIKKAADAAQDPSIRKALADLDAPLAAYLASAQEMVDLAARDPAEAQKAYGGFEAKFKSLEVAMEAASVTIETSGAADAALAQHKTAAARAMMIAAIIAGVSFSLLLVLVTFKSVLAPIKQLAADMHELATGNVDVALKGADRADEVGAIGRAVRAFQGVIISRSRAEAEEQEQRRAAAATAEAREQAERLERAKGQSLVVDSLAEGLERLSAGDLVFRINSPFLPEYEKLRLDFNEAVSRLQETLSVIAGNATTMNSATAEITQASDDLSRRTENQAASLEQTAAALDEITATVRQTAEGADQARNVVTETETDAARSGQVVQEAISAMAEIEKSASEIGQIIGVIDEIAFQTNLLALNAGVEAARAGDAGRGFAVVASEVRALAQRSADAAKDIKGLIGTSSRHVAQGVHLVTESGASLGRIVTKVSDINAIVTRIAASAKEQAVGLHEVNTAVNQMDQVTQQNAAMVEEATAASHSLAEEAQALTASISKFRLSATGAAQTRSAPSRASEPPTIRMNKAGGALRKPAPAAAQESWEEF